MNKAVAHSPVLPIRPEETAKGQLLVGAHVSRELCGILGVLFLVVRVRAEFFFYSGAQN